MSELVTLRTRPRVDLDDPISLLEEDHGRIEAQLASLEGIVAALARELSPSASRALSVPLHFFRMDGLRHVRDEELSVFPRLRSAGHASLVEALIDEHRQANLIFQSMRTVSTHMSLGGVTHDLVQELGVHARAHAEVTHEHVQREKTVLLPLLRALPGAEKRAVAKEMMARRV
ncbi:MAG: hemerythrin domain-containing protein [Deltaproteobacteria bacterium]|nr:hemerythrin domain-containing protein [Deltaproteobacteria bacterium]